MTRPKTSMAHVSSLPSRGDSTFALASRALVACTLVACGRGGEGAARVETPAETPGAVTPPRAGGSQEGKIARPGTPSDASGSNVPWATESSQSEESRRGPRVGPREGGPPARPGGQPRDVSNYPWLVEGTSAPTPVDSLAARFEAPTGFTRVELAAGSFGAWLRDLPLAAASTPVTSYRGGLIRAAGDPNVAAVVAIDVGGADLQQCADSVLRLDAEWRWSRGERTMGYRAAAGPQISFARWLAGDRPVARGPSLVWSHGAAAGATHATFRSYLDAVFAFANTGSLAAEARPVALAELRPGDFVVQPGAPGHAVLVLDEASAPGGRRALLLGQGFMPAQSFHVLRPASGPLGPWFLVDEAALATPFWPPFAWSSLRRLDG